MVRVTEDLTLSPEVLSLYHTTDPLLGHLPILIFHGPSTTANFTLNSSRVQIHIFSPAGSQSFPRITISPNSAFYSVVDHLPREWQGDEVYRGLAVGLYKYFSDLPEGLKTYLKNLYPTRGNRPESPAGLFGEQHAADIVAAMAKSDNAAEVIKTLQASLQTQHVSSVDIDFVLPPGAIVPLQPEDLEDVPDDEDGILDPTLRQYGAYTPLIKLLGDPVFVPTSRLRRAPSKPTSLNRSKSFTKDQKMELRMKMHELMDTEERYVRKLEELVHNIASSYKESAKERNPSSESPSYEELDKLFPQSAERILELNTAFMAALRKTMDATEEDAAQDAATPTVTGGRLDIPSKPKDPSGAASMAKLFLEWFPQFTECYQEYIKASQNFPALLATFLDPQSSFRQRVQNTGEQALRSLLIEPVQRLPRYSLLIDQIVSCLPMTHPALQLMLKARDVITNICSMDEPMPDKPHVASRLRNLVESWPQDLEPQGRLVSAADFIELAPPFQVDVDQSHSQGVFILFADCVVILKRVGGQMTARDLTREIDKPSAAGLLISMTNAAGGPAAYDFVFSGWHSLADVRFTESEDGQLIWMTSTARMKGAHAGEHRISTSITSRCFILLDGKAAKWGEDVTKARIEARFSESEREDPSWTLRSVRMPDNNLGIYAAVFQEGADQLIEGRKEPAGVRVVVDHELGTKGAPVGHYGVEIMVDVTSGDLSRVKMLTAGLHGKQYQDDVALEDFLPTLSRRLIQLLSTQFNTLNPRFTASMVSYYSKTLRALPLVTRAEKTRSFLASSPVKLFSSLWSGTTSANAATTPEPAPNQKANKSTTSLHRSNSQHSIFSSLRSRDDRTPLDELRPENPLQRLEETFTGFVACLQSRKGTIIGRMLLNRSMADELAVNDLYNRLIESPYDWDAASELSTEVVFVAFEKYLSIAWREQIGPVMTLHALDTLQARANKNVPGNFADFVNFLFGDMAPQNRRAFTALIKLLADLLDGCGNDGDRGALTLSFAELIVMDSNLAPNYINLLDRLVEDCDRIFEEPGLNHSFNLGGAAYDTINSAIRGGPIPAGGKSHSGSLTSNTSSLRRKFGTGITTLLRAHSQDERPSVWRTLSKNKHPITGEPSTPRATFSRTRSIDDDSLPKRLAKRPGSKDRPPIAGAFDDGYGSLNRPASSHRLEFPLGTIDEPPAGVKGWPRRKRRSSLSDLRSLMTGITLNGDEDEQQNKASPLLSSKMPETQGDKTRPTTMLLPAANIEAMPTPKKQNATISRSSQIPPLQVLSNMKGTDERVNASPKVFSPSRIPISPGPSRGLAASVSRQKENRPESTDSPGLPSKLMTPRSPPKQTRPLSPNKVAESPSFRPRHSKALSSSHIPTLRPAGSRPSTSAGEGSLERKGGSGKLRLQSPQRLRERLGAEKKAIEDVDASLRTELSKIGEEMARMTSSASRGRANTITITTNPPFSVNPSIQTIEGQLATLRKAHETLASDLTSQLAASEAKMKAVDQLYKEAMAENELLYERFNTELGKIVTAVRGKKGREDQEQLMIKVKEQGEEVARLKKEVGKLRREVISGRGKRGEGSREEKGENLG